MIPDGWGHRLLFECADQRLKRFTPAAGDARPYVALEHLAQGRPALLGWSLAGSATSAKTVFYTGDILFGKLRPNLRKAAVAPFDGVCSTDILPLFGKAGLDSPYLLQIAQWNRLQWHAIATSSGTKMPRTSWKQLGEFTFMLPPLPEQRKIAAILSSVDDAIEKTHAVIDQAQIVKRGLMRILLTRGLPERHIRFKQTETGEIPEDWATAPGIDLFRLSGGYAPKAMVFNDQGECLFVKVDSFNHRMNGTLIRHTAEHFNEISNPNIRTAASGSLVFPKRGAAIFKNRVRLLGTKATVDPNLMILTPTAAYVPSFLMYLLIHIGLFNLSDNSTIPQLNNKHLYPFLFPVPPIDEQEGIAESILAVDNRIASEEEQMIGLIQLKQALMSVLLTGEVRVTTDTEAA